MLFGAFQPPKPDNRICCEVTAVLNLQRQIAVKVGLPAVISDAEVTQLSKDTSIDEVAQTIRESLAND
jgi:hypothetical protein